MYSKEDLDLFAKKCITPAEVDKQIENFRNGFDFLPIEKAVTVGDGLLPLSVAAATSLAQRYMSGNKSKEFVKFVPASGAATRMFKDLYEFDVALPSSKNIEELCGKIKEFAFYDELKKLLPPKPTKKQIVDAIISPRGLNYGNLPKGLLVFHKYGETTATALEEHLVEAALYGASGGVAKIHFTVSPEHRKLFEARVAKVLPKYEKEYNLKYEISYSEQQSSTDTIAVNKDFSAHRSPKGVILFRPAGHGALINNLNALEADVVFIKTIDNVVHKSLIGDTALYKQALAQLLIETQQKVFAAIISIENQTADLLEIENLIQKELMYQLPDSYGSLDAKNKLAYCLKILNRPMRICGMVKNEGEPGGGPFWVRTPDGSVSLQIAESSQISPANKHLMQQSTHFNPVDLVCGIKNYKGKKFDLKEFVDPTTGFISEKSKDGRSLLAQELPGLWNGAMANWNTIFVEVPISTFNPVKIVNDLLRKAHNTI